MGIIPSARIWAKHGWDSLSGRSSVVLTFPPTTGPLGSSICGWWRQPVREEMAAENETSRNQLYYKKNVKDKNGDDGTIVELTAKLGGRSYD